VSPGYDSLSSRICPRAKGEFYQLQERQIMRIALAILGAALSIAWLVPQDAAAQDRSYRKKTTKTYTAQTHYRTQYRRAASVGSNGLCQRDTGTPTDKLNFNNRCDVEEFWNRNIYGGSRRP